MSILELTALEAGAMIRERKISCVELTREMLAAIGKRDGAIHAYSALAEEHALKAAADVQARIDAGEALSPLAGVPMGIKDNICTEGIETACGSRMLAGFIPPYSATAWERLKAAGAVPLGKLNMDEFAMGGSTETAYTGVTRNPWDHTRVPGGSSGGAAAAVAAGEAFYALGSDTGGSIRQPCAFCGVTGIKPTYGAVSRYGLVAYASSLDQIGPIGRDIRDCVAVLGEIAGRDARDMTSSARAAWTFDFPEKLEGLTVGIPDAYFGEGLRSEVGAAVLKAGDALEKLGARLVRVEVPLVEYAVPAYYIIACAEASSNLSRYDGAKYGFRAENADDLRGMYDHTRSEGFGMEVKRRIMLGSFVLSSGYFEAYYLRAQRARRQIQQGFLAALTQCDMLLAPVAPTTAFRVGENVDDPLRMYLGDIYTVSVNLAGLPAAALPCGFDGQGLPIGMQLIGRPYEEPLLVGAAHAYQSKTDHHKRRPPEGGLTNA